MNEYESLLLDVGNAVGVLAIISILFIAATGVAMLYQGIRDIINK